MRVSLRGAAALGFLCSAIMPADAAPTNMAATLRITVDGVTAAGGTLRVGLYDEATFPLLPDTPLFKREVPKVTGSTAVIFERLPPGTYAMKALQDVNNDGKAEPGEPAGVSNGAASDNFDAAAIVLQPGDNKISIRLR
jgi:uncharacterized protein (DUF2141 family)